MSELRMPSFGADMDAGVLSEWKVRPGDRVAKGDIVAVIETMKGAIDMEVFEDGTISTLLVDEGTRVPVGTPIAAIDGDGEAPPVAGTAMPVAETVTPAVAPPAGAAEPETPAPPTVVPPATAAVGKHLRASPLARSRALELGIDLADVAGSGPDGSIVLADIEQARRREQAIPTLKDQATTFDPAAMRQAIAAAMSRSKREIPHYYLDTTVDLTPTLTWLERHNADHPPEQRILLGAMLIKATANALRQSPQLNGYYRDGAFEPGDDVHIGMAINIRGGGLVVPALLHADRHPVDQLMSNLRDLTDRARRGGLRSSEMSAATVTVTSLGERGVEAVYGVIFPPQVAIIGFGTPTKRPWVTESGEIEARTLIRVTLAADHRVSDGHLGARFLRTLAHQLTTPETL